MPLVGIKVMDGTREIGWMRSMLEGQREWRRGFSPPLISNLSDIDLNPIEIHQMIQDDWKETRPDACAFFWEAADLLVFFLQHHLELSLFNCHPHSLLLASQEDDALLCISFSLSCLARELFTKSRDRALTFSNFSPLSLHFSPSLPSRKVSWPSLTQEIPIYWPLSLPK